MEYPYRPIIVPLGDWEKSISFRLAHDIVGMIFFFLNFKGKNCKNYLTEKIKKIKIKKILKISTNISQFPITVHCHPHSHFQSIKRAHT
jgi:hypothetical protein